MLTQSGIAGRVSRIFGDRTLQVNFQTANIEMASVVAGAGSYPILKPGTITGRKLFGEPVILLSVYMSTTFLSRPVVETACVCIARANAGNANLNAIGDTQMFLQQTLVTSAATLIGTAIQRNTGVTFAPPFFPLIPANSAVQLFGSDQTAAGLGWYTLATIYYLRAQELAMFQQMADG